MIDKIYNDLEKFNAVQSEVILLLGKNKPLEIMVKAAGYYDKVIMLLPRIIIHLTSSDEGMSILRELGLDEKIKRFSTSE